MIGEASTTTATGVAVAVLVASTTAAAFLAGATGAAGAAVRRRSRTLAPEGERSAGVRPWWTRVVAIVRAHRLAPPSIARLLGLGAATVQRRRRAELPVVLDALARSLRSGASVRSAVAELARVDRAPAPALADDLDLVAAVLEADEGVAAAMHRWAERGDDAEVRFTAAALAVGATAGSLSARTVEDIATVVRGRLDAAAEARALATQAQYSASVMVIAPIAFLLLVAAADRTVARVVLTTPPGWACVSGGLLLDLAAALRMRRIVGSVR